MAPKPAATFTALRTPIVDPKTGAMSWEWIKWFQDVQQKLAYSINLLGEIVGQIGPDATISGRGGTLQSILQNIDDNGVALENAVDFARGYINKDTDNIDDGTGSPLAGGKAAYLALVTSGPAAGQVLEWDGTDWLPHVRAQTKPATGSNWLNSYDAATGNLTATQPDFSDLSGVLNLAQLPAGGASATVTLAKITGLGADGSLTFTDGLITAFTAPT